MWSFIGFEAGNRHSNYSAERVQGNKCPSSFKNKFCMALVLETGIRKMPGSHVIWHNENTQTLFAFPQLSLAKAEIASSLVHKR